MGTHPIFESDFDCLTDMDKTWNDSGVEPDLTRSFGRGSYKRMSICKNSIPVNTEFRYYDKCDKILEEKTSKLEEMEKRHRRLNSELNEELIERRVKMEDFESYLEEIIKKAEEKLNTFSSPEKENRETQTPETVKRYDRRKLDKALSNVRNSSRRLNFSPTQNMISPGRIEKNSPKRSILPKPNHLLAASGLLSKEKPLESSTPNPTNQSASSDKPIFSTKPTQTAEPTVKPTQAKPVKPPKPQKLKHKPIRQSAF